MVRQKDEAHGEYRTRRLILERYDAMANATRTGRPYQTPLYPPPGARLGSLSGACPASTLALQ